MKTITCFSRTALANTLVLMSTLAWGGSGLHDQASKQKLVDPDKKSCAETTEAVMYTRDGAIVLGRVDQRPTTPDWRGGDSASLSPHMRQVLSSDADLNGVYSACRLVDADAEKDVHLNDGVDIQKLFDQINELLEFNKIPLAEQEHALLESKKTHTVRIELSDVDGQLHAYLGVGLHRVDLGSVREREARHDWGDGLGRSALPGNRQRAATDWQTDAPRASLSAVPEAPTYLMLLAGLGLLASIRPGLPQRR
ncbi:hypothetical protein AAKU55_005202 [Oxalobacteraceae bacterium GrIS 1.11]